MLVNYQQIVGMAFYTPTFFAESDSKSSEDDAISKMADSPSDSKHDFEMISNLKNQILLNLVFKLLKTLVFL